MPGDLDYAISLRKVLDQYRDALERIAKYTREDHNGDKWFSDEAVIAQNALRAKRG